MTKINLEKGKKYRIEISYDFNEDLKGDSEESLSNEEYKEEMFNQGHHVLYTDVTYDDGFNFKGVDVYEEYIDKDSSIIEENYQSYRVVRKISIDENIDDEELERLQNWLDESSLEKIEEEK